MSSPEWLLRAGFPYLKTVGMRRVTTNCVDIAVGSEGRLYVLNRSSVQTEIRKLTIDDEDLGGLDVAETDAELRWPVQVILDGQENLYVSDEALDRISVFNRDGESLGFWGESGDAAGQLSRPSGIAFDADENMLVTDTMNHRVQRFTKDGTFLGGWGSLGSGEGEFNMPWGLWSIRPETSTWPTGEMIVSRSSRPMGEFVFAVGRSGSGDGEFNRPAGIAVDEHGDIYVADRGNNRVQLFNRFGRYVEKFLGDATLSKMGRYYIMANAVTMRLRDEANLEPNKLLRGPASVRVNDDLMFIPDFGSHRVQIYRKEAYALDSSQIAPVPRSPRLQTT